MEHLPHFAFLSSLFSSCLPGAGLAQTTLRPVSFSLSGGGRSSPHPINRDRRLSEYRGYRPPRGRWGGSHGAVRSDVPRADRRDAERSAHHPCLPRYLNLSSPTAPTTLRKGKRRSALLHCIPSALPHSRGSERPHRPARTNAALEGFYQAPPRPGAAARARPPASRHTKSRLRPALRVLRQRWTSGAAQRRGLVPPDEWEALLTSLRTPLPSAFRVRGAAPSEPKMAPTPAPPAPTSPRVCRLCATGLRRAVSCCAGASLARGRRGGASAGGGGRRLSSKAPFFSRGRVRALRRGDRGGAGAGAAARRAPRPPGAPP